MATVAFYRALGVNVPTSRIWSTKTGAHHVGVSLANGIELHFDSPRLARVYNKGFRGKEGGGNLVIGFSVKTRAEVDKTYSRLKRAGYRGLHPPWDAFWGARYAVVADPDGNHVGIMSPSDPKRRTPPPDL